MSNQFKFADVFSGIGGFRLAFEAVGCRCVWSCEIDKFAIKTYNANFRDDIEPTDIRTVEPHSIPDIDILTAGFPCPSFSISGVSKRNSLGRKHGFDGEQGDLFFEALRIIEAKRPLAFILENVKNLIRHSSGETLATMMRLLEDIGYDASWILRNASLMVPQNRERVFIIGFDGQLRTGFDAESIEIPDLNRSLQEILEPNPPAEFTIPDGTWATLQRHRAKHRSRGNSFGYSIADPDGITRTLSARYYKDGSEILIDQGPGRNPRRLTVREGTRLMGFPEWFQIPVSNTQAFRQLGNAVVPSMIEPIAAHMVDALSHLTLVGQSE